MGYDGEGRRQLMPGRRVMVRGNRDTQVSGKGQDWSVLTAMDRWTCKDGQAA